MPALPVDTDHHLIVEATSLLSDRIFRASLEKLVARHNQSKKVAARKASFIQGMREAASSPARQALIELDRVKALSYDSVEPVPLAFAPLVRNGLVVRLIGIPDRHGRGKTLNLTEAGKKLAAEFKAA